MSIANFGLKRCRLKSNARSTIYMIIRQIWHLWYCSCIAVHKKNLANSTGRTVLDRAMHFSQDIRLPFPTLNLGAGFPNFPDIFYGETPGEVHLYLSLTFENIFFSNINSHSIFLVSYTVC